MHSGTAVMKHVFLPTHAVRALSPASHHRVLPQTPARARAGGLEGRSSSHPSHQRLLTRPFRLCVAGALPPAQSGDVDGVDNEAAAATTSAPAAPAGAAGGLQSQAGGTYPPPAAGGSGSGSGSGATRAQPLRCRVPACGKALNTHAEYNQRLRCAFA